MPIRWDYPCLLLLFMILAPASLTGAEVKCNGENFFLADGLTIELAAGPPLTKRPICVDFDEAGNLYIAESSGTNAPVKEQLKNKPHSILRLTDTDGDGIFDARTVFAKDFMFPEGCTWFDGSLYVSAPPQIWKLTDADGDGVAEQREVWFDGKTLTGCANDLHGPYIGRDGQIYWCKGAYAKQTYERPDGEPFVTRASHIFRHDPAGGFVEPVITGGMANPVGVAFTRAGEPILTATFLHRPSQGLRDGLIHAVYGGLFGQPHGSLEQHPRTGDLLPALVQMGAAAMAGITAVKSSSWNTPQQFLACSFNLHTVTRHTLTPNGATFTATTEPWLKCDNVDFHPTDVIEDADGSFLVVDTGGWYKLCCPTSQLHKPDVTGAIYRVRVSGKAIPEDPRGKNLDWEKPSIKKLIARLADDRFVVRERAVSALAERPDCVTPLQKVVSQSQSDRLATEAALTLTRIDSAAARAAIRAALPQTHGTALRVAIRAAGLWRDAESADAVRGFLAHDDPHVARLAAAALGRMDDAESVPALLVLAGRAGDDRFLFHAAAFALIEIAAPKLTRTGLASDKPGTVRASLLALAQMPEGNLAAAEVIALLDQPPLRETALSVAIKHPEWGSAVAGYLERKLTAPTIDHPDDLAALAGTVSGQKEVQALLEQITRSAKSNKARQIALRAMARSGAKTLSPEWASAIAEALEESTDEPLLASAIAAAAAPKKIASSAGNLRNALLAVAMNDHHGHALRLQALRPIAQGRSLQKKAFGLLVAELTDGETVTDRLLAADILLEAKLTRDQFHQLSGEISDLGPMELNRILLAFEGATDPSIGQWLINALGKSDSAGDVPVARLRRAFSKFGADVQKSAAPLFERPDQNAGARAAELELRLKTIDQGDPRRGQAVFQSSKAACATCHSIGYGGGNVGPDLTDIGKIRTKRDLLESILYPSTSFVRSYEPVTVVTVEGKVYSGIPRKQRSTELTLVIAADKKVTIARDEIAVIQPSQVSVMPAGLEKQLSDQELADLVMFLKTARW